MKKEILNKIFDYDKIIIHRHVSPDPDAMGSQMGMYHFISDNFPDKDVYVTGVFPERLGYFNAHSKLKDSIFEDALIIVTDTANESRIDDDRYAKGDFIIKIDHHPGDDHYGDINWVDSTKSSTSEMVYEFCKSFDEYVISNEAAELLLAGIVADTNRFLFPSTTVSTFEAAKQMKEQGVNFERAYKRLYARPFKDLKYYGFILNNLVIEDRVGYIVISHQDIKDNKTDIATSSNLIGELSNVTDFDVWVFVTEDKDNQNYRVNIRSSGPIINDVAAVYGGGGHIFASGVRMKDLDRVHSLINDLKIRVGEYNDRKL